MNNFIGIKKVKTYFRLTIIYFNNKITVWLVCSVKNKFLVVIGISNQGMRKS